MALEIHRSPGWTYRNLDQRQRQIAERVQEGGSGAILLSEVEPVITLGRRADQSTEFTLSKESLLRRGIDVYEVDRGGLATYHGPGQWVLFVVNRLEALTGDSRGVRKAVEGLLNVAATTALKHRSDIALRDGAETGVWTRTGKLASVGVHIEQGILLHGLALNAYRTPLSFAGIRPCGLDIQVDYLWEPQPGPEQDAKFLKLGDELIQAACQVFQATLDPDFNQGYKVSSSRILSNVGS